MPATPTVEQRRAAHLAAQRAEAMALEMLANGETGEVAIVVTLGDLTPEKRVTTKGGRVRIGQGQSLVERAG